MGNLIGENIPGYVGKQILKRQEIYGKGGDSNNPRTIEEISYLNSRTGWVKLASGTSMEEERLKLLRPNNPMLDGIIKGSDLAEKYVLFGGVSALSKKDVTFTENGEEKTKTIPFLDQRQGIKSPNQAYGLGGKAFGFAPMPGIIDASIKSLNRGSLKKATINIKAHNKNQLNIIDVLYMRLGYTVLLEWGNDKFIDNKGDFTPMGPTLIEREFFKTENNTTDYEKWLPLIEKEREKKAGNYEAIFGTISNFSWTFESDGSYSVKIDIISMGDVIESLKVNVPVASGIVINDLSKEKYLESAAGGKLWGENTPIGDLDKDQFIEKFAKRSDEGVKQGYGSDKENIAIDKTTAKEEGYFPLTSEELRKYWDNLNKEKEKINRYVNTGPIFDSDSLKDKRKSSNTPITIFISYIPRDQQNFQTLDEQILLFENELVRLKTRINSFERYYNPKTQQAINSIYIENPIEEGVKKESENWYFVKGDFDLWRLSQNGNAFGGMAAKTKEFGEVLKQYTQEHQSQVKAREILVKTQVGILKESKLSYLFFSIEEIASRLYDKTLEGGKYSKGSKDKAGNNIGGGVTPIYLRNRQGEQKRMGGVLNTNKDAITDLNKLGLNFIEGGFSNKNPADILFFDTMSIGEKGEASYYMRFGALLEYIQKHIFPKIVSGGNTGIPLLKIDTEVGNNVMYTIPNQLSTNPLICLIKNSTSFSSQIDSNTYEDIKDFFIGAEDYIGTSSNIYYGKIMNIYLNFTYIKNLLASKGIVTSISTYGFLSSICDSINDSLGGVNNLEPVINESTNTIYILEQTKIPGKEQLIQDLNIDKVIPPPPPKLEVFGYNKNKKGNNISNFVRNVGLTTAITKEYATMITIGATAKGSIPGEEATAFSRWNIGIKDRFKTGIKESDSEKGDFEKENEEVKNQYSRYINQGMTEMIGINEESTKSSTYTPNPQIIKQNTSTVVNFNKYLQASASLANPSPKNVETSVGFLPFNLSLEMDGLGGFKIYNKLEVQTKFLPSNYEETMEFVITGVDHKLSNNEWTTNLNTIGTSIGSKDPSLIKIGKNIPLLETYGTKELSGNFEKTIPSGFDLAVESFGYNRGEKPLERIKMLFLHHTAGHRKGDNGESVVKTFNERAAEGSAASTHDVIDSLGNREKLIPPKYIAYAQGVTGYNYNSIGYSVELMALGYFEVKSPDGKYWERSDGVKIPISEAASGVDFNLKYIRYKGYPVYQKYTTAQINETIKWIKEKLKEFKIKGWIFNQRTYNAMFPPSGTVSPDAQTLKPGVYTHNSVRADKSDIFPQRELIMALRNNFSKPII